MSISFSEQQKLTGLMSEHWDFHVRENPVIASFMYGDHRYDNQLPHVRPEDFAQRLTTLGMFRSRLLLIDRAALPEADCLNYDLFGCVLNDDIDDLTYRTYLLPLNKTESFVDLYAALPDYLAFQTIADYECYIERLNGFAGHFSDYIALMREGILSGYRPPQATLQGIDEIIAQHVVQDPTNSRLWIPFKEFPTTMAAADQRRLHDAGRRAIEHSVIPAYQTLRAFVRDEYLPAARSSIGASELPEGQAFYAHCIRYHTSLARSAQEIHALGLAEVKRIRDEMEEIVARLDFRGTFADFLAFLRTDDRFYAASPEALLKEVALILKRMDGELPRLFRTLPRTPYGIRTVPADHAANTTTAYYMPPAADGTRAGFYYVNTYDLHSRPLYELEALSLHEAVPGHHLQLALQQELGTVPNFRRFAFFTSYVEGWGLYAERLGMESGFYQDPYSNFGRLTYEMWRACRLVVDTGIHAFGWTRQQAIDFMTENSALTPLNIANEVDRYIAWPGQALAYKMGELVIRELRAHAEKTLKDRFDVRSFHDVVLLSGAVPLDILTANVTRWIDQQQVSL